MVKVVAARMDTPPLANWVDNEREPESPAHHHIAVDQHR
jgi:hypothetical protein